MITLKQIIDCCWFEKKHRKISPEKILELINEESIETELKEFEKEVINNSSSTDYEEDNMENQTKEALELKKLINQIQEISQEVNTKDNQKKVIKSQLNSLKENLNTEQQKNFNQFITLRQEFLKDKKHIQELKSLNKQLKEFLTEDQLQEIINLVDQLVELKINKLTKTDKDNTLSSNPQPKIKYLTEPIKLNDQFSEIEADLLELQKDNFQNLALIKKIKHTLEKKLTNEIEARKEDKNYLQSQEILNLLNQIELEKKAIDEELINQVEQTNQII